MSTIKKHFFSIFKSRFFSIFIGFYAIILLFFTSMTCHFSYCQKQESLLAEIDKIYIQLTQEFKTSTENLWQVYMPFADSNTDTQKLWQSYFTSSPSALSPHQKGSLEKYVRQMLLPDNNVQWIVLYNPNRDVNYILYNNISGLVPLSEDFVYLTELQTDPKGNHIYGMRLFSTPYSDSYNATTYMTYAICSNIPSYVGTGKIMVGYATAPLYSICKTSNSLPASLNFTLTNHDEILFDYSGHYNTDEAYYAKEAFKGLTTTEDGKRIYLYSSTCGSNTSFLSYYLTWQDFFLYCHTNTPLLIAIFILFAVFSLISYILMLCMIDKEVNIIKEGLRKIAENNLDYQIPTNFHHNGLPEISSSINQMTATLKNNIYQLYYYELKQRDAKLSELQSKFNPHFVYNALEMIRSRCQINGDDTTADLIAQMASIFRGLIGSKNFVPITEELSFSNHYLALFKARYEDLLELRYDFDKEILKYGIIRNLLQPLIENYFIHGFDISNQENYILFSGKSLDDRIMVLSVIDNGCGMTVEEMDTLNATLNAPIELHGESYGLKNLHQRLQLFYGKECGLTLRPNLRDGRGLVVEMTLLKMTCDEYEKSKNQHSN